MSVREAPPGSPDSRQPVAMMGLMHSRGESDEGRRIRLEDRRPNSSWPAIRAWPQFVRSFGLGHNREQLLRITLESIRAQGADAVDEALTRRERQQYYEYFEYFTRRAVRVNEAFRDHGVDYDEWVIRNWRENGRINLDLDSDEERGLRIPQQIPIRREGAASSSSAPALRELLIPPARVYDDPAFDLLDRDPFLPHRRHIQVDAEEDAARRSQEPEPGLEPDEPDSEEEPVAPRPPRVTVLNFVQPEDVESETLPDIDLFEGYTGPNPVDGACMPSPNQPFAAAAPAEEEGEELAEVDDSHTGPERATRLPHPTELTYLRAGWG